MNMFNDDHESHLRYQSFIIFEPASLRVKPIDYYLTGEKVHEHVNLLLEKIDIHNDDLPSKILYNQLMKLENMLDLLNDYKGVVMTKFFDRIWRRYSYVSHLGEPLINLKVYTSFFPDYLNGADSLIAARQYGDDSELSEDEIEDTEETVSDSSE